MVNKKNDKQKPNILLIYTDQQRYDTIHTLGNSIIDTPNFDSLVKEGVTFTKATTPSPVCMPARWSLHTGQWTSTHKCYSNHHPGPEPSFSLPGMLNEGGYKTGLVGKNHSFLQPDDFTFYAENPVPETKENYEKRQKWMEEVFQNKYERLAEEPVPGGIKASPTHAKTNTAMDFISECNEQPFFLWLSIHKPHTPYMVCEPYFSMYKNVDIPGPFVEDKSLKEANKPFRQQFHKWNNDQIIPFTDKQIETMRSVYYGMISQVDYEIGRLLKFLEDKNLRDNTLIIFTSDHGDYMGDHGLMTKSPSLYDCLVRIPMIFCWPDRIDEDRKDESLISSVDLLPTLVKFAGLEYPEEVEGINLVPYLENEDYPKEKIRNAIFSEYGIPEEPYNRSRLKQEGLDKNVYVNPNNDNLSWEANPISLAGRIRMIRTDKWKYIEEKGGTCELYNLEIDPHELNNLWNNPEYEKIQKKLAKKLKTWLRSINH